MSFTFVQRVARKRWASLVVLGAAGAFLGGCGGTARTVTVTRETTVAVKPAVPPPPLARVVPAGYRTLRVLRAALSLGPVPETIVTSVGPPTGSLGFHPADLQVLSWDDLARRWTVVFDAEKAQSPENDFGPQSSNSGPGFNASTVSAPTTSTPLFDPKADVHIVKVAIGSLLPGRRHQLVFSSTSGYGGSGIGSNLSVLSVTPTDTSIVYSWEGEGLDSWRIRRHRITADAWYWTPVDAHCCPSRTYHFSVEADRNGYFSESSDQRPYLGVLVDATGGFGTTVSPLRVLAVDRRSHAFGHLQVGDQIEGVLNAPRLNRGAQLPAADSVFDKLSSLNAGQVAQLRVLRGDAIVTIAVKLGSLADSSATSLIIPANTYSDYAL